MRQVPPPPPGLVPIEAPPPPPGLVPIESAEPPPPPGLVPIEEDEEKRGILGNIANLLTKKDKNAAEGVASSLIKVYLRAKPQIGKSGVDALATVFGTLEAANKKLSDVTGLPKGNVFESAEKLFREESKKAQKILNLDILNLSPEKRGRLWDNPSLALDPEWLTLNVGDTATQMLPMIGASMLGGPMAGAVVGGMQEGGDLYTSLREDGVDYANASAASLAFGAVTGVLNKIGLGKVMEKVPATTLMKKIAHRAVAGGTEAITEYMEEPFQAAFDSIARGNDMATTISNVVESLKNIDVIPGAFVMGAGISSTVNYGNDGGAGIIRDLSEALNNPAIGEESIRAIQAKVAIATELDADSKGFLLDLADRALRRNAAIRAQFGDKGKVAEGPFPGPGEEGGPPKPPPGEAAPPTGPQPTVRQQIGVPEQIKAEFDKQMKTPPAGLATMHEGDREWAQRRVKREGLPEPGKQKSLPETPPFKKTNPNDPMTDVQRKRIFALAQDKKLSIQAIRKLATKKISQLNTQEASDLIEKIKTLNEVQVKQLNPPATTPLLDEGAQEGKTPLDLVSDEKVEKPPKPAAPAAEKRNRFVKGEPVKVQIGRRRKLNNATIIDYGKVGNKFVYSVALPNGDIHEIEESKIHERERLSGPKNIDPLKDAYNAAAYEGGFNPDEVKAMGLWPDYILIPAARRRIMTRKKSRTKAEEVVQAINRHGYQFEDFKDFIERARSDDRMGGAGIDEDEAYRMQEEYYRQLAEDEGEEGGEEPKDELRLKVRTKQTSKFDRAKAILQGFKKGATSPPADYLKQGGLFGGETGETPGRAPRETKAEEEGDLEEIRGRWIMDPTNLIPTIVRNLARQEPSRTEIFELAQNSVDAGAKNIKVKFTQTEEGQPDILEFSDDGSGMTGQEVLKFLMTSGSVGKTGTTSMGGYGMASTPLFFIPEEVTLITIKNGIKSTVTTNKEELLRSAMKAAQGAKMDQDSYRIVRERTNEPSGTTYIAKLPNKFESWSLDRYDFNRAFQSLKEGLWSNARIEYKSTTPWGTETAMVIEPSKLDQDIQAHDPIRFNFNGTKVAIHFLKTEPYGTSYEGKYEVDSIATNKGMIVNIKKPVNQTIHSQPDFKIVLNFELTPGVREPNYPYYENRTQINNDLIAEANARITPVINKIIKKQFEKTTTEFKEMLAESPVFNGIRILVPFKGQARKDAIQLIMQNKDILTSMTGITRNYIEDLRDGGEKAPNFHLTIDPGVFGFRTRPEVVGEELYAINPFLLTKRAAEKTAWKKALEAGRPLRELQADVMTHTLVHEYSHKAVQEHYESFTSELFRVTAIIGHKKLAALSEEWEVFYDTYGDRIEQLTQDITDLQTGGAGLANFADGLSYKWLIGSRKRGLSRVGKASAAGADKTLSDFAQKTQEAVERERAKRKAEIQQKVINAPESGVSKRKLLGLDKEKKAKPQQAESLFGESQQTVEDLFKKEEGFLNFSELSEAYQALRKARELRRSRMLAHDPQLQAIIKNLKKGRDASDVLPEPGEAEVLSWSVVNNIRSFHRVLAMFPGTWKVQDYIVRASRAKRKAMQFYDDLANEIIFGRWTYKDRSGKEVKASKIARGSAEDEMVKDLLDESFTGLTPEKLRRDRSYRGNKELAIAAADRLRNELFEPIIKMIQGDAELEKIIGKTGYIRGYFPHMAKQLEEKYGKEWIEVARTILPKQFMSRFLKERKGEFWTGEASIHDVLPAYINSTMRTIHDIPAYDKARKIVENLEPGKLQRYAQFYLRNYMNDPRAKNWATEDSSYNKFSRWMAQRYYDTLIGLNWHTWALNLMQTTSNTFPELGAKYTGIGIGSLFNKEMRRKFHESGLLFDAPGLESGVITKGKKYKILHGGMSAAEYINRGIAYFGGLAKAADMGLVGEDAANYAMDIVDKTQFSYTKEAGIKLLEQLPPDLRVFQTFKMKELEFFTNLVKDAKNKVPGANRKLARFIIINTALPAALAAGGVDAWRFFISLKDLIGFSARSMDLMQKLTRWSYAVGKGLQHEAFGGKKPGGRVVKPKDIPADIIDGLYEVLMPAQRLQRETGVEKKVKEIYK